MKQNNNEHGNVLFLILIAVALFAALSYAVTQSTRSGGGSADREQSLLGSATLTQYPTSLRTAVVRMLLSGQDLKDLGFNAPSEFASVNPDVLVFSPDGGGAVHQSAPIDVMASGGTGLWSHNTNFYIPGIGRAGSDANTADLIAFLPNVNTPTCQRVNNQMGIGSVPPTGHPMGCTGSAEHIPVFTATASLIEANRTHTSGVIGNSPTMLNCGSSPGVFDGKPTGCFYHGTALGNVFYSVIIER